MDEEWVKTLANSQYLSGVWHPPDKKRLSEKMTNDLLEAIAQLIQEMTDILRIFNSYKKGDELVKIIILKSQENAIPHGFYLLTQGGQLCIEQKETAIEVRQMSTKAFQKYQKVLATYQPWVDAFGGLLWQDRNGGHLNLEVMAKLILKSLCISISQKQEEE